MQQKRAIKRIASLPLANCEIVSSNGRGGGLWLLWSHEISVEILLTSSFFIIAKIQKDSQSQPWILIAVYGDCKDHNNHFIWDTMEQYIRDSGLPVCTIGHYNVILDYSEKKGGPQF